LLLDRLCKYEDKDLHSGNESDTSDDSDSDVSDANVDLHRLHSKLGKKETNSKATPIKSSRSGQKTSSTLPSRRTSPTPSISQSNSGSNDQKKNSSTANKKTSSDAANGNNDSNKEDDSKNKKPQASNKPKPNVPMKVRKVQPLECDENGKVKLPVTVGILTVISLGAIVYDRDQFHNDRYIWPVGYKVSRLYNSMIDANVQTTYTCSILDGGEGPKVKKKKTKKKYIASGILTLNF
jgi:hypothetical protein